MFQNNKLYQRFFKLFCSCHPENTQDINQAKANELWVTVKKNNVIDMDIYNQIVNDLAKKAKVKKEKRDIRNFFLDIRKKILKLR